MQLDGSQWKQSSRQVLVPSDSFGDSIRAVISGENGNVSVSALFAGYQNGTTGSC